MLATRATTAIAAFRDPSAIRHDDEALGAGRITELRDAAGTDGEEGGVQDGGQPARPWRVA